MVLNPFMFSICSKHSSTVTDLQSGEIICSNCGIVIDGDVKMPQNAQEWNPFSPDKAREGTGGGRVNTLALHDKGLATVIGIADKDAAGKGLDATMHLLMGRLRKWDSKIQIQTRSSTDRNLRIAFHELGILRSKLGLPDSVIEKAAYIYRKVQKEEIVKGRSISAAIGASVYIACRDAGIPRTLKEIATLANIRYGKISSIYRIILLNLDLKVPSVDPVKCLSRIANRIRISEKTKRHALDYMHNVIASRISDGKDPMSIAAAVLYLSCRYYNEPRIMLDVAEAAGITDVTLRIRSKEIFEKIPQVN
jgi:transcription initiation factor TFIIB